MILSMTGFGEARARKDGLTLHVEARSVNNRHLKINCRVPDGYGSLEPEIETKIRSVLRRGTVYLTLQVDRQSTPDDYEINQQVLQHYFDAIKSLNAGSTTPVQPETLLALPGVIKENDDSSDRVDQQAPIIMEVVGEALTNLANMRAKEGATMATDMKQNRATIARHLEEIAERAPEIVEAYQSRLRDRLGQLLKEFDIDVQPQDVVREVGLFADRADIAEEIVRLRSHLEQFDSVLESKESAGRKLEFLIQEMVRETNTIGSKANDSDVAKSVVEIKTIIERIREMVQNIE